MTLSPEKKTECGKLLRHRPGEFFHTGGEAEGFATLQEEAFPVSSKGKERKTAMMNGINTTLCYLRRGGETLLLHRVKKEGDMNRDKWIGVGGKFLPGESPEDCLRREVMEETGLTLHGWAYRGIVTFVSDQYGTEYMHLFESWDFSGEVRDCDEGVLEWLPWAQLPKLPIWEGDKLFLRLLDSRRGFFSLKLRYEGERLAEAALDGVPLRKEGDEWLL